MSKCFYRPEQVTARDKTREQLAAGTGSLPPYAKTARPQIKNTSSYRELHKSAGFSILSWRRASLALGTSRVKKKVAPRLVCASAQIRPLCFKMIR
jgi:hypothetical protein